MRLIMENFTRFTLKVSSKDNVPSCVSFVHNNSCSFLSKSLSGWISSFMYETSSMGTHVTPESQHSGFLRNEFGFTFPWPLRGALLLIWFCPRFQYLVAANFCIFWTWAHRSHYLAVQRREPLKRDFAKFRKLHQCLLSEEVDFISDTIPRPWKSRLGSQGRWVPKKGGEFWNENCPLLSSSHQARRKVVTCPSWDIVLPGKRRDHPPALRKRAGAFSDSIKQSGTQPFYNWTKKKVVSKANVFSWEVRPRPPTRTLSQVLPHGKEAGDTLNVMKCQVWASIQILLVLGACH